MKYLILVISTFMLMSCEKNKVESVTHEVPNIEMGMSAKNIESFAMWEIERRGNEARYKLGGVVIYSKDGIVDQALISNTAGKMPFTIEKLDSSNLSVVESYHNTERSSSIGPISTHAYTKDEAWFWYGVSEEGDVRIVFISNKPHRRHDSGSEQIPVFPPYDLKDMAKIINQSYQCRVYVESQGIDAESFTVAQKVMFNNVSTERDSGKIKKYIKEIDYKYTEQECVSFLNDFIQLSDEELMRLVQITKLES